jgi:hypothetical protein
MAAKSKIEVRNKTWDTPKILWENGVHFCIISDHPVVPIEHLSVYASLAMRAGLRFNASRLDRAASAYDVVVAYVRPAVVPHVPDADFRRAYIHTRLGRRAVDDDFCDGTHTHLAPVKYGRLGGGVIPNLVREEWTRHI